MERLCIFQKEGGDWDTVGGYNGKETRRFRFMP